MIQEKFVVVTVSKIYQEFCSSFFPTVYVPLKFMLKPYVEICITDFGVLNMQSLSIYLYWEIA